MLVQKSVMWASNRCKLVAHLTHEVPPAALPGGRAPDGQRVLWFWPKTATLTDPVYTCSGCLVPHLCESIWCMCLCGCMRNGLRTQKSSKSQGLFKKSRFLNQKKIQHCHKIQINLKVLKKNSLLKAIY